MISHRIRATRRECRTGSKALRRPGLYFVAPPNLVTISRAPTERKTGLYVPNVETARLVRDERGWLRLAS
jgi:hypothetical protein